jgi:hypothetical protein
MSPKDRDMADHVGDERHDALKAIAGVEPCQSVRFEGDGMISQWKRFLIGAAGNAALLMTNPIMHLA